MSTKIETPYINDLPNELLLSIFKYVVDQPLRLGRLNEVWYVFRLEMGSLIEGWTFRYTISDFSWIYSSRKWRSTVDTDDLCVLDIPDIKMPTGPTLDLCCFNMVDGEWSIGKLQLRL